MEQLSSVEFGKVKDRTSCEADTDNQSSNSGNASNVAAQLPMLAGSRSRRKCAGMPIQSLQPIHLLGCGALNGYEIGARDRQRFPTARRSMRPLCERPRGGNLFLPVVSAHAPLFPRRDAGHEANSDGGHFLPLSSGAIFRCPNGRFCLTTFSACRRIRYPFTWRCAHAGRLRLGGEDKRSSCSG